MDSHTKNIEHSFKISPVQVKLQIISTWIVFCLHDRFCILQMFGFGSVSVITILLMFGFGSVPVLMILKTAVSVRFRLRFRFGFTSVILGKILDNCHQFSMY